MKKRLFTIWLLAFGLLCSSAWAQDPTQELLDQVLFQLDKIQSFEADALIKVDVDFIDIKDREVRIKFTAPDTFEFDTKGLALLPKNGVQMEYMTLMRNPYTGIPAGKEVIGNTETLIIKLIPESIESDIVLAQLWIDPQKYRILRMKTFTRKSGSYTIDFSFADAEALLPTKLDVAFEIEGMGMLPGMMMNELMTDGSVEVDSIPKQARVIVEYKNFSINLKK